MGKCRQIHRAAGLSSWPRHSEPGWMDSIDVAGRPIRWCATCGKRLALGPANDEPAEVRDEIEAARLASHIERNDFPSDERDDRWADYGAASFNSDCDVYDGTWHGWLAAAILAHTDVTP
jgi:hypothetical protein